MRRDWKINGFGGIIWLSKSRWEEILRNVSCASISPTKKEKKKCLKMFFATQIPWENGKFNMQTKECRKPENKKRKLKFGMEKISFWSFRLWNLFVFGFGDPSSREMEGRRKPMALSFFSKPLRPRLDVFEEIKTSFLFPSISKLSSSWATSEELPQTSLGHKALVKGFPPEPTQNRYGERSFALSAFAQPQLVRWNFLLNFS